MKINHRSKKNSNRTEKELQELFYEIGRWIKFTLVDIFAAFIHLAAALLLIRFKCADAQLANFAGFFCAFPIFSRHLSRLYRAWGKEH